MYWYGKLCRIEAQARHLEPDERHATRQTLAVPMWDEFLAWAPQVFTEGVAHGRTGEALSYVLQHQQGLRAYCQYTRLLISNIKSEHSEPTHCPRAHRLHNDSGLVALLIVPSNGRGVVPLSKALMDGLLLQKISFTEKPLLSQHVPGTPLTDKWTARQTAKLTISNTSGK